MKNIFLFALMIMIATACVAQKELSKQQPTQSITPISKTDMTTIREPKTIVPAYDFSKVHICIDKVNNKNLPVKPAQVRIPKIKSNGQIETVGTITQGLSALTEKMWSPGDIITVGFFGNETTALVISKVKIYAKVWESFANIKFQFINDVTQAQVKVGFANNGMSWSWLGRDVLNDSTGERTVNFGWFTDQTYETEFRRVIVHEFGHVLGFIHEHQSPTAGIPWDKEKVYAYFGGAPNYWSHATIDRNIFDAVSKTSTNSSTYDRLSIMHYFFPKDLVTDGSMFTENTNLSTTDMQFSKQVYPFPSNPPTATGVLLTGDDCDEIEFSVEYNVVDKNLIEFTLEPGRDPHTNNIINWWKKIAIPVAGNGEVGLEMQDGYSATQTVPAAIIDKNRGIGFGKAKIAGVHTGLNYKWNAWPAILGGCRVKLKWRRDKC
jgi:serralysin